MPITPVHPILNLQYRLSGQDGCTSIKVRLMPLFSVTVGQNTGAGEDLDWILERTRRSAEAHSLLSRYFSF
jgi:hypothetical protein